MEFKYLRCLAERLEDHYSQSHRENCRQPAIRITRSRRRSGPVRNPAVPAAGEDVERNPMREHDFEHERDSVYREFDVLDASGRVIWEETSLEELMNGTPRGSSSA